MDATGVFDYVIIGGGSAGCVLANRLTADPATRVLLIEAGGRGGSLPTTIPAAAMSLLDRANPLNWGMESEPETALDGRVIRLPRGRGLGGTSSINGMVYVRGNAADYDGWQSLGLPGWSYADVLPYFRLSEDQAEGASAFHGTGGPLHVAHAPRLDRFDRAFIEAAQAAGHRRNHDFNGATQEGVGRFQANIREGRRWDAYRAFLEPVMQRPNLTVLTSARVARILVEDGRAIGVEYRRRRDPTLRIARARGEVLLCGGTYHSPHILQCSGIGDGVALRAHGVPVLRDLPGVGANLQDHAEMPIVARTTLRTLNREARGWRKVASGVRYLTMRSGPASRNSMDVGGFVRSTPDAVAPDLQMHFVPAAAIDHVALPHDGLTLYMVLLQPESRGRVSLRSPDPFAPPAVRSNLLAAPADMAAMRRALAIGREIMRQPPLGTLIGEEIEPVPGIVEPDAIDAWIRSRAGTLFHPVGTCAMGRAGDPAAVLDHRLRLRGVDGLRVVDAAAMPRIPRGNTNAPTYMIAEKAADMIRQDARLA